MTDSLKRLEASKNTKLTNVNYAVKLSSFSKSTCTTSGAQRAAAVIRGDTTE